MDRPHMPCPGCSSLAVGSRHVPWRNRLGAAHFVGAALRQGSLLRGLAA